MKNPPEHAGGDPPAQPSAPADTSPLDFEQSLRDLEAIVARLEQGDLPLEESLRQFERGVELTRLCQSALRQAEQKVEILVRRSGLIEPFTAGDDEP